MKVQIEKLDHFGRGIFRNEKIIFVENALPEEIVEIKITNSRKKFDEAKCINVIKESIMRTIPNCQYYNVCGGCNLLHMKYSNQKLYKETKVKEIIQKFLKEDIKIKNIISTDNQYNYRNKITLHVENKMGFYETNSKCLVNIDQCNIVDNEINKIINKIETNLSLENVYEIMIRKSKYTNESMVVFKINDKVNEQNIINVLNDIVTSIIVYQNKKYKTIYGPSYIKEKIGTLEFLISPDSFFQVNTEGAKLLYDQVKEYCNLKKNDRVLDLYCGTGTIGMYLSSECKNVVGVEINKFAVEDANRNKEHNQIQNMKFICGDSNTVVNTLKQKFDVIVVDPPRAGLDKNTITYLKQSGATRVVYVSCDPVTLARDLNILKEVYDIIEITPVDMFPNTYHVECVCLLKVHQTLIK